MFGFNTYYNIKKSMSIGKMKKSITIHTIFLAACAAFGQRFCSCDRMAVCGRRLFCCSYAKKQNHVRS